MGDEISYIILKDGKKVDISKCSWFDTWSRYSGHIGSSHLCAESFIDSVLHKSCKENLVVAFGYDEDREKYYGTQPPRGIYLDAENIVGFE